MAFPMALPQRSLVLLLVPLAVLAAAGFFFVVSDPVHAPDPLGEGSSPSAPLTPSGGGGTIDMQGDQAETTGPKPLRAEAVDSSADALAVVAGSKRMVQGARVPRGSHFVRGRVNLPEGTPLDEELFVIASGRPFKTMAGHPREYSAPVDDQGNFAVAFAEGSRKGRLWISARYCFSPNIKVIDPTSKEDLADLVLEAELGGCLDVEVVPPRVEAGNLDFHEKVTVELRQDRAWSQGARAGKRAHDVHFEIGGVKPNEKFLVEARHPDYANGEVGGIQAEPGVITTVVVNFGRGVTLSGEVRNLEGNLITHASVMALTTEQAGKRNPFMNEKIDEVVEDGDGTFELVGVPPGDLVILVTADGYLELRVSLGKLVAGEHRSQLILQMGRGLTVEGAVAWPKGGAASGALVRISQKTNFMGFDYEAIMGEVKVGAEGKFAFSGLGEGDCRLEASSFERGYVAPEQASLRERLLDPPPIWRAVEADVKPGRTGLVLVLSEGQTIPGKVVDDLGNPVERFQIIAAPSENNILSSGARKRVKDRFKSKVGRFDLAGLQAGAWTLVARGLGYGAGDEQEIIVPFDGEVSLRLPREAKLTGVVRDPNGKLLQDAKVHARHGGGKDSRTDSKEEGVFSLARLNPGPVEISASHDSWARSIKQTVQASAGETGEGVIITLRRGGVLTVELHSSIPNKEAQTISISGPTWRSEKTNARGVVVLEGLEPGAYTVSLTAPRQRGGQGDREAWFLNRANKTEVKVDLANEERRVVILGEPSPTAVIISGIVTSNGKGVAKAVLSVLDPANTGSDQIAAAVADVSGHYELTLDAPGEYQFMVGPDWQNQGVFSVTINQGVRQKVDFELPNAGLEGILRGPGGVLDGAAIALSATIDGKEVGGRRSGRRTTKSGPYGRYSFSNLTPGTYNLRVMDARSAENKGGAILIQEFEIPEEGRTFDVDLRMAGTLVGVVRDGAGQGLNRGSVTVTSEDGTVIKMLSFTRTRAGGSYRETGLGPGDVWVQANYKGEKSSRVRVSIREGDETSLDLVVP